MIEGKPKLEKQIGIDKIKYIWKTENKVIEIKVSESIKYNDVTNKDYLVISYFSISYQNLELYNRTKAETFKDIENTNKIIKENTIKKNSKI